MSRGKFIIFEGGDSVGKTTQIRFLMERLATRGIPSISTREPGGTPLGALIRGLVLDPAHGDVSPLAEALLYAADKAQHVHEVIEPALVSGVTVVCDRYVDSTLAYQGAGRNLDMGQVEQVSRWATGNLRGDLTILLDGDPARSLSRIRSKDRLEGAGLEFHTEVRRHFLELADRDPQKYLVIPAFGDRFKIADQISERVLDLFKGGSTH